MGFILWNDVAEGIETAIGIFGLAETELSGETDLVFSSAKQALCKAANDVDQKFDKGLQDVAIKARRILENAPTGKTLIENIVQKIEYQTSHPERASVETPWLVSSYLVSKFFVRGARLARDIYQTIYPSAKSLVDQETNVGGVL